MQSFLTKSLSCSILACALFVHFPLYAADENQAKQDDITLSTEEIQWKDAPGMPKGAQMVVIRGDLTKPGPYTLRLKFPDGYVIPSHWHTNEEQTTVLSGTLHAGRGDTVDKAKSKALPAGSYSVVPGKAHHYVWTTGETVIQNDGMGPRDTHFVDINEWKELIKKSQEKQ